MKKFFDKILFGAFMLCVLSLSNSFAQQDFTLHFMRNVTQSSYTNPAYNPRIQYFVGVPLLSSIALGYSQKGFVLNDLISKPTGNDSLQLDVNNALEKNGFRSFFSYDKSLDILSLGYNFRDFYFGLNITERTTCKLSYTKDVLGFLWNGNAAFIGKTPDMTGFINASRYRELGLKFSYDREKIRFGVRAKLLSGMMNIKSEKDTFMYFFTDTQSYENTGKTDFLIHTSGLNKNFSKNPSYDLFNTNNLGVALDLGVDYRLLNNKVSLSFSIKDLGGIWWETDVVNYTSKNDITFVPIDLEKSIPSDSSSFKTALDTLNNLLDLKKSDNAYYTSLAPKFYASVLFSSSPKVTWGALFYLEFVSARVFPSGSLYYGKKISDDFEISVSYSVINNTFGNLGGGVQYRKRKYQFYLATDNLVALFRSPLHQVVFKEYVASLYLPPYSQVYSVHVGVNISINQPQMMSKPSVPY